MISDTAVCFVVVVDFITLLSIYLPGNLDLSQTIGGISLSLGRKFTLSANVKGSVLGIWVLYDTFVIVLLFGPLFRCLWFNRYSVDIL